MSDTNNETTEAPVRKQRVTQPRPRKRRNYADEYRALQTRVESACYLFGAMDKARSPEAKEELLRLALCKLWGRPDGSDLQEIMDRG